VNPEGIKGNQRESDIHWIDGCAVQTHVFMFPQHGHVTPSNVSRSVELILKYMVAFSSTNKFHVYLRVA